MPGLQNSFYILFISVTLLKVFVSSSDHQGSQPLSGSKFKDDCDPDILHKCGSVLLVLTNRDFEPPETEEELIKGCKKGKDAEECVRDHASRCLPAFPRQFVRLIADGAGQTIDKSCTKEGLAESLKHAPCLNANLDGLRSCLAHFTRGFTNRVQVASNIEEKVSSGCCLFGSYKKCTSDHLTKHCGEETSSYFSSVIDGYTSDIFDLACAGYDLASDECKDVEQFNAHRNSTLSESEEQTFFMILLKAFSEF